VKFKLLFACVVLASGTLFAQITGDVIGMHDLSPGSTSPITGARPGSCGYCHAPHSGLATGKALWNQTLTRQVYSLYTSTTYNQVGEQPLLGAESNLCLSCHDGTVAVGQTLVSGQVATMGKMYATDVFANNLQSSHPISVLTPLKDGPSLVATLVANGQTADPTGAIKLVNGNIECTSCHNPHVEAKDPTAKNFLVKNSVSGAMCLACHDPNRVVQNQTNPLAGWTTSIHATNGATVQNLPYTTLSANACFSCHTDHNGAGASWLLRGAGDQVCLNCHAGGMSGAVTVASANPFTRSIAMPPGLVGPVKAMSSLNVASEYAKVGHPVSTGSTQPKVQASAHNRNAVTGIPNAAGQTGCTDCHEPHAITAGATAAVTAPLLRSSQKEVWGVSEKDGVTVVRPAQYQFQTCLRCHGANAKSFARAAKYGYEPVRMASVSERQNLIPQFGSTAGSSHPVFHPRTSPLSQPSLLPNMMNLDGLTQGRAMGTQIYCTDCHNSDDNREFGGMGPTGPHGSKWGHILERRYELSQAMSPGQPITNLFPNPDLSVNGPYAMCAKCHNLSNVLQNASFAKHAQHINAGFSCSTCHTGHGVGNSSANPTGQRLISFDANIVAPNSGVPISYNQGPNTCTLTCHNAAHNPNGTVTLLGTGSVARK